MPTTVCLEILHWLQSTAENGGHYYVRVIDNSVLKKILGILGNISFGVLFEILTRKLVFRGIKIRGYITTSSSSNFWEICVFWK